MFLTQIFLWGVFGNICTSSLLLLKANIDWNKELGYL